MATLKMDSSGYTTINAGTYYNNCTVKLTPGVLSKITLNRSSDSTSYTMSFEGEVFGNFKGSGSIANINGTSAL